MGIFREDNSGDWRSNSPFGESNKAKAKALQSMHDTAVNTCNGNKVEAREVMRRYVACDRRFDNLDHSRLVQAVEEHRTNGAHLDLDSAWLRGGPKDWRSR
jgi:hypothetical protein